MIFVLALSNVNETNERPMDKLNFLTEDEVKILHKTLGVLVGTVGKQKAGEILDEMLNNADRSGRSRHIRRMGSFGRQTAFRGYYKTFIRYQHLSEHPSR